MAQYEDARERLVAWIRDYGQEKQPVFLADLKVLVAECERLQAENERLREIVERKQTLHWDLEACQCWFCVSADAAGCSPRESYLPHHCPPGTYRGDQDCPEQYREVVGAAGGKS